MSRYAEAHMKPAGPGDSRPTAFQIIIDEGLEGALADKVFLISGCSVSSFAILFFISWLVPVLEFTEMAMFGSKGLPNVSQPSLKYP